MHLMSLDEAYFERVYSASDDPWHFETSAYEAEKYDATIAALEHRRFERGLEIGCSIGVLTRRLADVCTSLLSLDLNERALSLAAARCSDTDNVRFERMRVPQSFPVGKFDLILVSEVGYYWSDRDLSIAIDCIARAASGGTVELVHYLPKVADYPRDGDSVHEAFLADERFTRTSGTRAAAYRIDVFNVR